MDPWETLFSHIEYQSKCLETISKQIYDLQLRNNQLAEMEEKIKELECKLEGKPYTRNMVTPLTRQFFPYQKAICYSGYREGQSPAGKFPSREQVYEDLTLLVKEGFTCIRMYEPNEYAKMVLTLIREHTLPLTCMIGIDSEPEINAKNSFYGPQNLTPEQLAKNAQRNDAELDKLIALAKEFQDIIVAVSVGNENQFEPVAHLVSEERLIAHAKKLRASVRQPITFNEDAPEWHHLQRLVDHLDFISVHHYPYHHDITVEYALADTKQVYNEIRQLYPNMQVIFTEIGWATSCTGDDHAPNHASVENQKRYITELLDWFFHDKITGFLFEMFDEPWKASSPDATECNWGLYTVDRVRKW